MKSDAKTSAAHLLDEARVLAERGEHARAERVLRRVPRNAPEGMEAARRLGVACFAQGDFAGAEKAFARVLTSPMCQAADEANHGLALAARGQTRKAEAAYRRALSRDPGFAEGWFHLANLHREAGDLPAAEDAFHQALMLAPHDIRARFNLGLVLLAGRRARDAIAAFEAVLTQAPQLLDAQAEIGNALTLLGDQEGAEARYRHVLEADPGHGIALANLGRALAERRRFDEALNCFGRAVARPGAPADTFVTYAETLLRVSRTADGEVMLRHALAMDRDHGRARALLAMVLQWQCRWDELDGIRPGLVAHSLDEARAGRRSPIAPHMALSQNLSPAEEKLIAESWSRDQAAAMRAGEAAAPFLHEARARDRIRIGYFSNDFNSQATAHLIVGLFEHHDRDRFEVCAYSFGDDDGSSWRRRIEDASDRFADVTRESYRDTAARMHRDGVDILLDFKGFTAESRPQVYALKPAPIQVNYLGFPGTIGADYMDYLIADEIVIPPDERAHYAEKIVYLPECYQANDDRQQIADRPVTRAEAGLPEGGIVFSCFNETYKIDRAIFAVWMRILARVPGSALWLRDHDDRLRASLRDAAQAAGIDPARLVFAGLLPKEEHLARCRLADLFLDSYALTAHTTATDSLWAGVPMITCPGNTFARRVGRSLLSNLGMEDLVVPDLVAYEELAVRLASSPDELARVRARLADNQGTAPLFDTARLTRHLEGAFEGMWTRFRDGRAPESFRVDPLPR